MQFAIIEISGRQYLAKPGQIIEVDKLNLPSDDGKVSGEAKNLSVDKILLIADKDKLEVGKPYLKKTLNFEVVGNVKKPKIRVATYKAKANYRRVKGQRREVTKIRLLEESKSVKKD